MMETILAAKASITKFFEKKSVDGQAMVEYALILVLVAIAVIVLLTAVGTGVNNTFQTISNELGGAS